MCSLIVQSKIVSNPFANLIRKQGNVNTTRSCLVMVGSIEANM